MGERMDCDALLVKSDKWKKYFEKTLKSEKHTKYLSYLIDWRENIATQHKIGCQKKDHAKRELQDLEGIWNNVIFTAMFWDLREKGFHLPHVNSWLLKQDIDLLCDC